MHSNLQKTALKIQNYFINKSITISCAESCSGGLLCAALTRNPDSSKFFKAGLITYSNQAKEKLLYIDPEIIKSAGAVSEEIAYLMAQNCRRLCATDVSLSITGIAGPSSDEKSNQVGLVYIGQSCLNTTKVQKLLLKGDRKQIRRQAVASALEFLYENLGMI